MFGCRAQWIVLSLSVFLGWSQAAAHCEVPCGIYDDQMRLDMIAEDITTIEKSMKMIKDLETEKPTNWNQLVRWIKNKEDHADRLQHSVSQYFLTQRIKPDTEKYPEQLAVLHKMLLAAMKSKQSLDSSHVDTLRSLLKEFSTLYLGHSH